MFYSLFPLILIFAGLAGIAVIVARKFSQMASLDVEKLPEVRQAKVKEEIKFKQFSRSFSRFGLQLKRWLEHLRFLGGGWKRLQSRFRRLVHYWQEKYQSSLIAEIRQTLKESRTSRRKKTPLPKTTISSAFLLKQAEEAHEKGEAASAERLLIEAIKQNPREIEAYRSLGKVYLDLRKYKEAKETFEFLLKLKTDDDRAYNCLGMAAEGLGKKAEAIRYFEEATRLNDKMAVRFYDLGRLYASVRRPAAALRNFARAAEIESNNPKYLDQLLEMSIITGDVDLAKETYDRLRLVNPENQKLPEFRQRIEETEE